MKCDDEARVNKSICTEHRANENSIARLHHSKEIY